MIYFVYEVVPCDGRDTAGKIFASCWINTNDLEDAKKRVGKFISAQGYSIVEHVESYSITRRDYEDSPEGLEYYEQALIDDEVMVLFMSEGHDEDEQG